MGQDDRQQISRMKWKIKNKQKKKEIIKLKKKKKKKKKKKTKKKKKKRRKNNLEVEGMSTFKTMMKSFLRIIPPRWDSRRAGRLQTNIADPKDEEPLDPKRPKPNLQVNWNHLQKNNIWLMRDYNLN